MSANLVPFSSAGGFSTTGNVVAENVLVVGSIGVSGVASPAPTINGFSSVNTGNISLNGGYINGGTATVVNDGINSIALSAGATMDVYGFPFVAGPARGQLTITDVTTPSEANGTWYYQSVNNSYTYQIYTDSTYSTLVDASGWSAYTGGGSVAITLQDPPANIVINTNGFLTTFANNGNLTISGAIRTASNSQLELTDSANTAYLGTTANDSTALYLTATIAQLYANTQISFSSNVGGGNAHGWYFDEYGNTSIPGNIVSLGNIGITTNVGNTTQSWTFDNTGNLTLPGNISGNTAGFAIGYRDIPQVSFTGNATIATTDAGRHYYSTLSTGNVLTIANNASQGFQVGAAITIINQGTGNITVAQGSGVTLYLAGNATSGNRTVATFGMATLVKVATDTWFINGTGVS